MKFIWLNLFYLATPRGLVFLIEMIAYHLVYGLCQPCTQKSANKRQEDHVKYEAGFFWKMWTGSWLQVFIAVEER